MSDDIEALLSPRGNSASPEMQDRVLTLTTRIIRHRVWRKRGLAILAMIGCYAAGVGTMALLHEEKGADPASVIVPAIEAPTAPTAPSLDPRSPGEIELAAEQRDGADAAQMYLTAGLRYARAAQWESAVRCYRNALDADPDAGAHEPSLRDDWLFTTLKDARRKERTDVSSSN